MQKFILLLTLTAVLSAQYAGKIGNGDYMDLMSIYGDHTNRDEGMIMGDYIDGPMVGAIHQDDEDLFSIYGDHTNRDEGMIMGDYIDGPMVGAIHQDDEDLFSIYGDHTNRDEGMIMGDYIDGPMVGAIHQDDEELFRIGKFLGDTSKKVFSKENIDRVGKFAAQQALAEAQRQLSREVEEELKFGRWIKKAGKKVFSKKNMEKVGKFAAKQALAEAERRLNRDEEELKFGRWIKKAGKKVFSKKNMKKVGKFAAKQALAEAERRLNRDEQDLESMVMELNDNQEMNMICQMNDENKCEGLKEFIAKIKNLISNNGLKKKMLQKVLNALETAKEIAVALKENKGEEDLIMNVCVHQNHGNMYSDIC